MINILPIFKGYTVDIRLKEFRKVPNGHGYLEFVPFYSPKGERLLDGFIKTLDANTEEGLKMLGDLW